MAHIPVTLVTCCLFFFYAAANIGVDVSQPTSVAQFKCMASNGASFAIPRIYEQVGHCDQNGIQSINNARAAGIQYVDGYIFPCLTQGAAAQISAALSCLHNGGANFGMLWLDIEGQWGGSQSGNAQFIVQLSQALDNAGVHHGIYTSASQWNAITGGFTGLSHLPLWYPHWDQQQNFNDFSPFGGWTKPAMKQYLGNGNLCGQGVDMSWW